MLRPERSVSFCVAFLSRSPLASASHPWRNKTRHVSSFLLFVFSILFLFSITAFLLISLAQYDIDQKRVGTPSLKQPAEPLKEDNRARVVRWRRTTRVPLLRLSVAADPAQTRRAKQPQQHRDQHKHLHPQQGRTAKHFLHPHQTRYRPLPYLFSLSPSSWLLPSQLSGSGASG